MQCMTSARFFRKVRKMSEDWDEQQRQWYAYVAECKTLDKCPHSGYTVKRCKETICDCFDPFATDGDLHPEYFVIGRIED